MLIDWFTVGAQIANFLILLFLLKRFLYGPILRAMDRREERIAERLREADEKRSRAEEIAEEHRRRRRELDDEREKLLQEARQEAERRRKGPLEKAETEAQEARRAWEDVVRRERDSFLRQLRQRTGTEVVRVARRALADLVDADLGGQLAHVFSRRLRELEKSEREACSKAAAEGPVAVRSSFELDAGTKGQITKAFRTACGAEAEIEYRLDPGLAFGLELMAGDLRLQWGGESYLDGLERSVSELLDQAGKRREAVLKQPRGGDGEGTGPLEGEPSKAGGGER